MAKGRKNEPRSQQAVQDLVTITLTEDLEHARDYEALLKENEVPAVVRQNKDAPDTHTFAVMVPEDFLDEAHVIIESQDAYRDFCQYAFEDNEEFADEGIEDDEF